MKKPMFIPGLLPTSTLLMDPRFSATARARTIESAVADAKSDVIKANPKELNTRTNRLGESAENAPTPEEKATKKTCSPSPDAKAERKLEAMHRWSFVFLVLAVNAGLFGFTSVFIGIAKILFFPFLILFALFLLIGLSDAKKTNS
jgi:uncharacterized membrane protein YtjA (UPF0391 family)